VRIEKERGHVLGHRSEWRRYRNKTSRIPSQRKAESPIVVVHFLIPQVERRAVDRKTRAGVAEDPCPFCSPNPVSSPVLRKASELPTLLISFSSTFWLSSYYSSIAINTIEAVSTTINQQLCPQHSSVPRPQLALLSELELQRELLLWQARASSEAKLRFPISHVRPPYQIHLEAID
jgi:hypothetical protein